MRRKEALFAVIGGVVGAILTMVVGSFSPLGAHNEVTDAEFGEIICRRIRVVGWDDTTGTLRGKVVISGTGGDGYVLVYSEEGNGTAIIGAGDEHGGYVTLTLDGDSRSLTYFDLD